MPEIGAAGDDRDRYLPVAAPPLDCRPRGEGQSDDVISLGDHRLLMRLPAPVNPPADEAVVAPAPTLAALVWPEAAHIEQKAQAMVPLELQSGKPGNIAPGMDEVEPAPGFAGRHRCHGHLVGDLGKDR